MGWISILVLLAVRLNFVETNIARAASEGGALIFRGSIGMRVALSALIFGCAYFTVKGLQTEDWGVSAGLIAFLGLGLAVWPSTIAVTKSGVEQRWWWRHAIMIAWDDVCAVDADGSGNTIVSGKSGRRIKFDRLHIDRTRFRHEVERRATRIPS